MSEYDETVPPFEPVRDAMLAVADRLEKNDPDESADMNNVLEVADFVTEGADQSVLAGMIALILTPDAGETNRQYAARLRAEVSD
ncbi:hypothetical protein [Streptomyces sp. NPDC018693]|uniref:hypothetical protein n=1 Tax=unclassified Streptomyces TaxID=2593676 RepID=UPI0037949AC5